MRYTLPRLALLDFGSVRFDSFNEKHNSPFRGWAGQYMTSAVYYFDSRREKMKRLSFAFLLVATGYLMSLLTAEVSKGATAHRFMNLPGRTDNNPYSNAVLTGDTLYLAGSIGIDPETGAPPEDIKEEVKIVMDSMKTRLEMAGMTMGDLVMVQVHCPDLSLYDEFNAVYRTYFQEHFPARAFLGSGPLLAGGHFEVLGIAIKQ